MDLEHRGEEALLTVMRATPGGWSRRWKEPVSMNISAAEPSCPLKPSTSSNFKLPNSLIHGNWAFIKADKSVPN
jgi:hypothetical protein